MTNFWVRCRKDLFIQHEAKGARGSFLVVAKQGEEAVSANGTLFNS